jgi:hypothetical protein
MSNYEAAVQIAQCVSCLKEPGRVALVGEILVELDKKDKTIADLYARLAVAHGIAQTLSENRVNDVLVMAAVDKLRAL